MDKMPSYIHRVFSISSSLGNGILCLWSRSLDQIWCVPGQEFLLPRSLKYHTVFLRTAPTSWGRDMLCCSFVSRCQIYWKSLDVISAEAAQVIRCWLVPKINILQLYPISLQLAIVQSALNTSLCIVCLLMIANCVSGQPCTGHIIFHWN